jgi:hypothetical protein
MWIASLSNGESVREAPDIAGQPSGWQALLARLRAEPSLRVTQLRLQDKGVTLVAMAHAERYVYCREALLSLNSGAQVERCGIGTVLGDAVVMSWLDESRNVFQDVRPLSALDLHATPNFDNS